MITVNTIFVCGTLYAKLSSKQFPIIISKIISCLSLPTEFQANIPYKNLKSVAFLHQFLFSLFLLTFYYITFYYTSLILFI